MFEPASWQRGAIYRIYPRSFADSDGNGVGDLRGIRAHLDRQGPVAPRQHPHRTPARRGLGHDPRSAARDPPGRRRVPRPHEELGLPDAEIPPDRVVDVDGRDPERAPIPWRPPSVAGPGAGFTTGEPWLPLVADAERLCVERQAGDPRSMLTLVRRLGEPRRRRQVLQIGVQRSLDAGTDVLAWLREVAATGCWPPSTSPPPRCGSARGRNCPPGRS